MIRLIWLYTTSINCTTTSSHDHPKANRCETHIDVQIRPQPRPDRSNKRRKTRKKPHQPTQHPLANKKYYETSIFPRTVKDYNSLTKPLVFSDSLKAFKAGVRRLAFFNQYSIVVLCNAKVRKVVGMTTILAAYYREIRKPRQGWESLGAWQISFFYPQTPIFK